MDEIFGHWPTVADFARDIGQDPVKARQWKNRRSIPAEFDKMIVAAAARRGFPVTLDMLATARATAAGRLPVLTEASPNPAR